jgi:flagellin
MHIDHNNYSYQESLQKLSSGLRINKAADDASGLQIADSLRSNANTMNQSIKNANNAIKIISIADSAIDTQTKLVDLIKQKSIQSAQDGQNLETRKTIQKDIDKLLDSIDNISSSVSYNGMSLLSGQYTGKRFQIGAHSSDTISINIGSTDSSKIGHTSFYKSDTTDVLSSFGVVGINFLNTNGLHNLGLQNIVLSTSAGTGIGALAEEINRHSAQTGIRASYNVEHRFSNHEDVLYASSTSEDFEINGINIGAIEFEDNDRSGALVNGINAHTDQTGVIAYVTNEGYLRLKSPDGRGIYVEKMYDADTSGLAGEDGDPRVNVSWVGDTDLDIVVVDPNGEALGFHASSLGTIGLGPTSNNRTTSTGGEWDIDDTGGSGVNQENFFWKGDDPKPEGEYSVYVKGYDLRTHGPQDFTITIITNGKKREIEGTVGASGDELGPYNFSFYNEKDKTIGELMLTKSNSSSIIGISGTNLNLIGMGSDDSINKYVSTLRDIRVISSAARRADSIDIAESAIKSLDSIRANLGSTQNQLVSSINVLSMNYVNTKKSESMIRDVDFAQESANFQKSSILAQAGSFSYAQANKVSSYVLYLLA